jgi:ankyrin repeat protein
MIPKEYYSGSKSHKYFQRRIKSGIFKKMRERQIFMILRRITKHGADINIKNNKGETALSLAKKKELKYSVDLLVKAGAKE